MHSGNKRSRLERLMRLTGALGRLEELRMLADYTDKQISPQAGFDAVSAAEKFIQAVERGFDLDKLVAQPDSGREPEQGGKVEEPDSGREWVDSRKPIIPPFSLDEVQRKARENWLRLRAEAVPDANNASQDDAADAHAEKGADHDGGE
jgi:plasmid stabilization system protein ParE